MSRAWSLSSYRTWSQCGLKYKLRYIVRQPEKRISPAADRGIVIHKEVENFLTDKTTSMDGVLSFYNNFMTGLKKYQLFIEHKIALTKEWKPTEWTAEDAWHKSVLDLKVVTPKTIGIYDWKTGRMYPDHMDQKEIYAIDALSEHPDAEVIRTTHVYFDLNKNTERTYYRQELIDYRKKWEQRVERMEADNAYVPNPGPYCRNCPFSHYNGGICQF